MAQLNGYPRPAPVNPPSDYRRVDRGGGRSGTARRAGQDARTRSVFPPRDGGQGRGSSGTSSGSTSRATSSDPSRQHSRTSPGDFGRRSGDAAINPRRLGLSEPLHLNSPEALRRALHLARWLLRLNPLWSLLIELIIALLRMMNDRAETTSIDGGYEWSGWRFSCGGPGGVTSSKVRHCPPGLVTVADSQIDGGISHLFYPPNLHIYDVGFYQYVEPTSTPGVSKWNSLGAANLRFNDPNPAAEPPKTIGYPMGRLFARPNPAAKYDADLSLPGDAPVQEPPPYRHWNDVAAVRGYSLEPVMGPAALSSPNPRRPGRDTKEKKVRVVAAGAARRVLDAIGETADFVEALWDALPPEFKKHKTRRRPWPYRSEKPKVHEMARDLYDAWDKLGIDYFNKAFDNVVLNQIEDFVYGKLGQTSGQAAASIGRPVGFQTGPGL